MCEAPKFIWALFEGIGPIHLERYEWTRSHLQAPSLFHVHQLAEEKKENQNVKTIAAPTFITGGDASRCHMSRRLHFRSPNRNAKTDFTYANRGADMMILRWNESNVDSKMEQDSITIHTTISVSPNAKRRDSYLWWRRRIRNSSNCSSH